MIIEETKIVKNKRPVRTGQGAQHQQCKIIESPRLYLVSIEAFTPKLSLLKPLLAADYGLIMKKAMDKYECTNLEMLLDEWKKDPDYNVFLIYPIESSTKSHLEELRSSLETFPPKMIPRSATTLGNQNITLQASHQRKKPVFESRVPIGICIVSQQQDCPTSDRLLHVHLQESFCGKGYATEAAKSIIKKVFFPLSSGNDYYSSSIPSARSLFDHGQESAKTVERFVAFLQDQNGGAWARVLEKLGFRPVGKGLYFEETCSVYTLTMQDFTDLWMIE